MVTIEVTQEDIDKADHERANNPEFLPTDYCPIAQAATRVLGEAVWTVLGAICRNTEEGNEKVATLPLNAFHFMQNWDLGCKVSPITFEVELLPKGG